METSFFLLQKNLHLITVCNGTLKVSETQNKTFYWFRWKITIISFSKSSPGAVSSQWLLSPKFSWLCTYPHSVSSLIQDMNKKKRSEALNRKKKWWEKQNQNTEPAESFLSNTTIAWEAEECFFLLFLLSVLFILGLPHQCPKTSYKNFPTQSRLIQEAISTPKPLHQAVKGVTSHLSGSVGIGELRRTSF